MNPTGIKIDPSFRDLIPPLSPDELDNLHASIDREGIRDPLVVWEQCNILLDGHHRHAYATAKDLQYKTVSVSLDDQKAAERWIILNQLGRRNLSPDAAAILRGKLYRASKQDGQFKPGESPNPRGRAGKSQEQEGNSCPPEPTTAEAIAKQAGVSPRTVKNDAAFSEAAEKLGVESDIIAGRETRSRKDIIAAAKGDHPKPKPPPTIEPQPVSDAKQYASMAIRQLQRIRNDDPKALGELKRVSQWIAERMRDL